MRYSTYVIAQLALLFISVLPAAAQTPIVTVVTNYTSSATGLSYALGGNMYFYGAQSGTTNNIQNVVGFSLPDGSYYYNEFVPGQIKIRRVNNPIVTGRRCLVWVEAVESPGSYRIALPYVDSMELFFNGQTLNKGTDNLFGNQGDGAGNNNNIERVDWVVEPGISAYNPAHSGFPIFERGADNEHDPFCIAAITSLDAGGNPLTYGPIVRVNTAQYGNMVNSGLNWSILRKEQAEPRLYRTTAGVQRRGGVFISMADLGVAPASTIYGYSLFAHDLPLSATRANLLDYTNTGFFPTNTSSNTSLGGIDLIAIAGLYNLTDGVVLPLRIRDWQLKKQNNAILLSWQVQNKEALNIIEIEKKQDGKGWQTVTKLTAAQNNYTDAFYETNVLYRLKLITKWGNFIYSDIKKINAEKDLELDVQMYSKLINVSISGGTRSAVAVAVYDVSGNMVLYKKVAFTNKKSVQLPHALPKGIYVVELRNGVKCVSKKLTLY